MTVSLLRRHQMIVDLMMYLGCEISSRVNLCTRESCVPRVAHSSELTLIGDNRLRTARAKIYIFIVISDCYAQDSNSALTCPITDSRPSMHSSTRRNCVSSGRHRPELRTN